MNQYKNLDYIIFLSSQFYPDQDNKIINAQCYGALIDSDWVLGHILTNRQDIQLDYFDAFRNIEKDHFTLYGIISNTFPFLKLSLETNPFKLKHVE